MRLPPHCAWRILLNTPLDLDGKSPSLKVCHVVYPYFYFQFKVACSWLSIPWQTPSPQLVCSWKPSFSQVMALTLGQEPGGQSTRFKLGPYSTVALLQNERGPAGEWGGEEYRDMEDQEAHQAAWGCPRKWNVNDFSHHPYVSRFIITGIWWVTNTGTLAPKDQVSRAAKMLAEEFVSFILDPNSGHG